MAETKVVFASSIGAHRILDDGVFRRVHTVVIIQSVELYEEACTVALGLALDRFPVEDGWEKHDEVTQKVSITASVEHA